VRLDRAGWARDRARMFAKPMSVKLENLQILPGKTLIKVQFVQHWSSGSYADVGPKQIVLTEIDGRWLISSEEMLASHPPSEQEIAPGTASGQFAFVEDGTVVLAQVKDLCDGPSTLEDPSPSERYDIHCPVKAVSLPAELAAWKTEPVTLYGESGPGCTTRLTNFEMVGRAYIMGGVDEELDDRESVSERTRLKAVWRHMTPLLVGKPADCSGDTYRWARVASLPKPTRARIAELPASLSQTAKRAFHELPGWASEQKQCGENGKDWEDLAHDHLRHLITARIGSEPQKYVSISAETGDCGGSCGRLFGIFRLTGKGKASSYTPLFTDGEPRELVAAFDSDGDGRLEFIFRERGTDHTLRLFLPDSSGKLVTGPSIVVFSVMGCGC